MRMLSFLLITLSDLLTLSNAMRNNSNGNDCEADLFELRSPSSVRRLNDIGCTTIYGSLYIDGLEPDECSNSTPLALDTVSNITGSLWIRNLCDSYKRFSDLLPNLRHIGGKCGRQYKSYTFILIDNRYLEKFGLNESITLENGCPHGTDLDLSSMLTRATTKITRSCSSCSLSNHFYCPPSLCCGSYSVSEESDLEKVQHCLEIKNNLFFSGNWSDEQIPKLEQALGQLRIIHGYLVVANTRGLKSLSFLKSLVSVFGKGEKWNGKYAFALFDNSDLMHLWENVSFIGVNHTEAIIHGNPFLCKSDYQMLMPGFRPDGGGNSIVGACNWEPKSNATRWLGVDEEKKTSTSLKVDWSQTYTNETRYFYMGTEVFYGEISSNITSTSAPTCPPSLSHILLKSGHIISEKRLNLAGSASSVRIAGLTSGRKYAVYIRSIVLMPGDVNEQLFDCSDVKIFSTSAPVTKLDPLDSTCTSIKWSIASEPDKFLSKSYYFEVFRTNYTDSCEVEKKDFTDKVCFSGIVTSDADSRSKCPCLSRTCSLSPKSRNSSDLGLVIVRRRNGGCSGYNFSRLEKINNTITLHNVSRCFSYSVRAKFKNVSSCSAWSNELKFFPSPCSHEIEEEMNVSVTFSDENPKERFLFLNWTDPLVSLCRISDYRIKVWGSFNASTIDSPFLVCKMNNTYHFCEITVSARDERRRHLTLFVGSFPTSLRIDVFYCLNGKRRNVSIYTNVEVLNHTSLSPLHIAKAAGILFCIIITAVAFICLWRMRAKRRLELKAIRDYLPEGYFSKCDTYKPDNWEIDRGCLSVGKLLGEGAFGNVYMGELQKSNCS